MNTKTLLLTLIVMSVVSCTKEVLVQSPPAPHISLTQKASYFQVMALGTPWIADSIMPRYVVKINTLSPIDTIDFEYRCIYMNTISGDVVVPRNEFTLVSKQMFVLDSSQILTYVAKKPFKRYVALPGGLVPTTLVGLIWVRTSAMYTIRGITYRKEPDNFNPLSGTPWM